MAFLNGGQVKGVVREVKDIAWTAIEDLNASLIQLDVWFI
jgi:hypothetical protein